MENIPTAPTSESMDEGMVEQLKTELVENFQQAPSFAEAVQYGLEGGYSGEQVTTAIKDLLAQELVGPIPETMASLNYSVGELVQLVSDGADETHLGRFNRDSHFGDLYDQGDGLNSTESGEL